MTHITTITTPITLRIFSLCTLPQPPPSTHSTTPIPSTHPQPPYPPPTPQPLPHHPPTPQPPILYPTPTPYPPPTPQPPILHSPTPPTNRPGSAGPRVAVPEASRHLHRDREDAHHRHDVRGGADEGGSRAHPDGGPRTRLALDRPGLPRWEGRFRVYVYVLFCFVICVFFSLFVYSFFRYRYIFFLIIIYRHV